MGSRGGLLLLNGPLILPKPKINNFDYKRISSASSPGKFLIKATANNGSSSSLEPPDVARLAEIARISLSPEERDEFTPKIRQMIDWFGQLQAVDLDSVEPAIRADTEGDSLRDDIPETFERREAIIAALPSYDEPYIEVPKVLNKE